MVASIGLLALLISGGIWAGLELTSGAAAPATPPAAPAGYHLVQARGPVEHVITRTRSMPQPESVDLATGATHPVRTTTETWFDPRGGLLRYVSRVDGRVDTDRVQPCALPCVPTVLRSYWPVDAKHYVRDGSGIFHGGMVDWLRRRGDMFPPLRVALDARTHEAVGYRSAVDGKVGSESWGLVRKPDIPSDRFWFVVPNQGFGQSLAYSPTADFQATGMNPHGLRARRALGRTALWLGARYRGHSLQVVTIGSRGWTTRAGVRVRRTNFVMYDYGVFRIEEFGGRFDEHDKGPGPGRAIVQNDVSYAVGRSASTEGGSGRTSAEIEVQGRSALLNHGGLMVQVRATDLKRFALSRAEVVALAKALRPVPTS